MHSKLIEKNLVFKEAEVSLQHMLDNSKAESGGERDVNFLKYLVDNKLLIYREAFLKRSLLNKDEEYYKENYKKAKYESDRHFLCRTMVQEELKNIGVPTMNSINIGDMSVLRANSCYDIVTNDLTAIIDIGLTPARNYFRGLTDSRVKLFLISTYFDDYMDDILFSVFARGSDEHFFNAVKDYEEGFKLYKGNLYSFDDKSQTKNFEGLT